jgi:hypothetical protein
MVSPLALSLAAPPERLPLIRVLFVGLVVPIVLSLVDQWLLSREYYGRRDVAAMQAMLGFVVQVGLLGVLCGRLIQPAWLRWVIYAWCLLLTDLNTLSSLKPETGQVLLTAQIGLVTVWAVLGTARWRIRVPVVLVLIFPLLSNIAQTAALCLICLVLRSQRFRLALVVAADDPEAMSHAGQPASRPIQFGVGDVLLWTTALAPLLAVARLGDWQLLTEGVLHAIVLVVALWAALGAGPAWLRWPLLGVFILAVGLGCAYVDWNLMNNWTTKPAFGSAEHRYYFWQWQWTTVAAFMLSGGMLAATLLIYRVLGYRLCHESARPAAT